MQPRDEIDANRRFVAVLPDAAPAIIGAKFAIGNGSTAQIIQQAKCSGATISDVGSDQVTVALADGQSCVLSIIGSRYSVTFTGATLSRTGAVYSLTSGTLTGGPFGGVVPKPNLDVTDVTGAIDIPNQRNATPTAENGTDYGDVLVGADESRTFRVVNNGDAPLRLLNNPLRLDNATDFQIETNLSSGDVLEPGASRTFTLRFARSRPG